MLLYFIKKDFIGYPIDIISGDYTYRDHVFIKTSLNSETPSYVVENSSIKYFKSLADILQYKICSCKKEHCGYNANLYKIVIDKMTDQEKYEASMAYLVGLEDKQDEAFVQTVRQVARKKNSYLPIEGEEGLFYAMKINGQDYKWVVTDREDGTNCLMMSDAKNSSLKHVIDRFKREFAI